MEEVADRKRVKTPRPEWSSHYKAWKKSAISKSEYCRRHDLVTENFYYWCRRLAKEDRLEEENAFIPIISSTPLSTGNEKMGVEIFLPNDVRLKVLIYPKMLSTLIQELNDAATVIR